MNDVTDRWVKGENKRQMAKRQKEGIAKHTSYKWHDKAHDKSTSLDTSMPNAHLTAFWTAIGGRQKNW